MAFVWTLSDLPPIGKVFLRACKKLEFKAELPFFQNNAAMLALSSFTRFVIG
jgi:hypothetical protein